MKILWATKIGEPDWKEDLITEVEADIPAASEWAKANGFDRLRIAEVGDEPEMPEFGANLLNCCPRRYL